MTSPVGALMTGMLGQLSAGSEFSPVVSRDQRRRLLHGLFDSYYADQPDRDVIFDTNRMWCSRMPALRELFPQSRVIACVRNVAWVMDSVERLYRANPFEHTKLFADDSERSTVYSRVESLAQGNRMVGFAWSALREAYFGEHAGSMLVIDYDLLAHAPEKVLRLVYEFIDEPWFGHDFENVEYDAPEFDLGLGVAGLHKVRRSVGIESRRTVLPPDLFEKYAALSFWNQDLPSAAHVIRNKNIGT